jgi:hypothetical protein
VFSIFAYRIQLKDTAVRASLSGSTVSVTRQEIFLTRVSLGNHSDVYRKCKDAGQGGVIGGSGGPAAVFSVSHRAVFGVRCRHWSDRRVGAAGACARVFLYGCERAWRWVGVRVYLVFVYWRGVGGVVGAESGLGRMLCVRLVCFVRAVRAGRWEIRL